MRLLAKLFLFASIVSACGPVTPFSTLPTAASQEYQDFSYQMVWSADDSMIALTTNTGLYIYDTKSYEQLAALDGVSGATAVFSKKYLAATTNTQVFVWNLENFSEIFNYDGRDEVHFQNLAISPDDKLLVTSDHKQIRYWTLPDGELTAAMPFTNFGSDMVFSSSGKLILADSYLGTIQEWDIQTQEKTRTFGFTRPVVYFNLSRDGKLVVVDYGDYGFETWDVDTETLHHEYTDIIGAPGWNNLSGDHQTVVVWGYGIEAESGLSVWDLSRHKKIFELSTPLVSGDGWRYGALNSDGTVLAASNNEGYIYFYDLKSRERIGEIYLPYKFTV